MCATVAHVVSHSSSADRAPVVSNLCKIQGIPLLGSSQTPLREQEGKVNKKIPNTSPFEIEKMGKER